MKRAILATLEHCASTDDSPAHHMCPEGEETWCFYNKLIHQNKDVPAGIHNKKIRHPIRKDIKEELLQVYKRFCSDELLSRCSGFTQNANESLNGVMWSMAPKTKFFHSIRMQYLIGKASKHTRTLHERLGSVGKEIAMKYDRKSTSRYLKRQQQKEERRRKKSKDMRKEEPQSKGRYKL